MTDMNTTVTTRKQRGFAMLFAVLTSSVLLSIGLSIFSLTVKELALSSAGKESQIAFYAADSGVECALYWDITKAAFATSSSPLASPTLECAGQDGLAISEVKGSSAATTTFSFAPTDVTPYDSVTPCVFVSVAKYVSGGSSKTQIQSRGYNVGYETTGPTPENKCTGPDTLKVERALLVNY
ncbi:MAG: hypothetical protein WC763_04200 [Candidatus Paceibacterota bacterium]|jgi:Tfp pilus assembly protein PilX